MKWTAIWTVAVLVLRHTHLEADAQGCRVMQDGLVENSAVATAAFRSAGLLAEPAAPADDGSAAAGEVVDDAVLAEVAIYASLSPVAGAQSARLPRAHRTLGHAAHSHRAISATLHRDVARRSNAFAEWNFLNINCSVAHHSW